MFFLLPGRKCESESPENPVRFEAGIKAISPACLRWKVTALADTLKESGERADFPP